MIMILPMIVFKIVQVNGVVKQLLMYVEFVKVQELYMNADVLTLRMDFVIVITIF